MRGTAGSIVQELSSWVGICMFSHKYQIVHTQIKKRDLTCLLYFILFASCNLRSWSFMTCSRFSRGRTETVIWGDFAGREISCLSVTVHAHLVLHSSRMEFLHLTSLQKLFPWKAACWKHYIQLRRRLFFLCRGWAFFTLRHYICSGNALIFSSPGMGQLMSQWDQAQLVITSLS